MPRLSDEEREVFRNMASEFDVSRTALLGHRDLHLRPTTVYQIESLTLGSNILRNFANNSNSLATSERVENTARLKPSFVQSVSKQSRHNSTPSGLTP